MSNKKLSFETNLGAFELEMNAELAPISVDNFVQYATDDFFTDTIFHRVIPGFVIQGGGHLANMERKETRAPIQNEASNGLKNLRGTISMARTNDPDSATSQFFINLKDNAFLDPTPGNAGYAVFGAISSGMDIIDKIAACKTSRSGPHSDVPVEPIVVLKVTVS